MMSYVPGTCSLLYWIGRAEMKLLNVVTRQRTKQRKAVSYTHC
jgi:hypothetical protein